MRRKFGHDAKAFPPSLDTMTSVDFDQRLCAYAAVLLDRKAHPGLLRSSCEALFQDCVALTGQLPEQDSALASGKALSALEAARCLLDFQRSTVLLRAVDAAIRRCIEQKGSASLLYAGCGPFATLVLPLLARYPAERLQVSLLDVHAHSLTTAETLCAAAGVADRLRPSLCADAATLTFPNGLRVDALVVEVMQRALAREPQFAALANLLPQCAADVELVPARIRVSAALMDPRREFDPEVSRVRVHLADLLELSQDSLPGLLARIRNGGIACPTVEVPEHVADGLPLILRTRIEANDDNVLDDYDSGLSYPLVLSALGDLRGGDRIEFHYRLGSDPGFQAMRAARDS